MSDHLYLASIVTKNLTDVLSVEGLGLAWTRVKAQCSGRSNTGVEIWKAIGNPTGDGVVTANLASTPSNSIIAVTRYSGVDPSTPLGMTISGNTLGLDGACSGGADTSFYAFDFSTLADGSNIFGAIALRNRRHTPGAGYAERGEFVQDGALGGDKATLAIVDRLIDTPSTVTLDGTFNKNVDWAVAGIEIRAGGSGGGGTQFSLNVNTIGSGNVSMNPAGGVYDENTVVSITATPAAGYQFSGWSGDLNGLSNPATITMNSNKNVTATFTEVAAVQYNLTTNVTGLGTISLDPPGGIYNEGTVVTVTAVPNAGHQFDGWSGDLTGATNPTTITMDGHKTVAAAFSELPANSFSVTVNINGSGSVTLDPPGGIYDSGTVITLTAVPGDGAEFSAWGGDLSGANNPSILLVNSNKSITATFSSTGGGGGPVVYEGTVTGGATELSTVATAGDVTAVNGDLYLASIVTKNASDVLSVNGLGLNWSRVKAQCSGRGNTAVEIWRAIGTPSGNGIVTASLASTPSNSIIAVSRYSGVDSSTPLGMTISGNTLGLDGACSSGADTSFYAFDFTTISDGSYIFGAIACRNRRHTPGTDYLERGEFVQDGALGGDKATLAIQDRLLSSAATVPFDGTFNRNVDWAVAAVEIRAGGSGGGGSTQYNLTTNVVGSGSINLNPAGGTYSEGTVVTLTATPAAGFEFSGWSGDLSGSANPAALTMNANKTVTAIFTEVQATQFTLSTSTNGSGSIGLSPAGGVYNEGTVVTLTATPAAGFVFSGWSGDLSGSSNPATLTMNANKNVTAVFTIVSAEEFSVSSAVIGQGPIVLDPPGGVYTCLLYTSPSPRDPE